MNQPIYSADPLAGYLASKAGIDAAVTRVLGSGRYILGAEGEAFEQEFARYLGCGGAVGVANGTDAIELALRALGIGPGDKVATVANSVSATAAAIVATGAAPVYIDIEPDTMLMDPALLGQALQADPKIKAVVPVHLYGLPCDLPAICEIARRKGVKVLEDCAQAHGAMVGGRKAGAWGDLAAFSFYPTKNLAALGDGGAVVGSDPALLEKVRQLRQYGWQTRYVSEIHGRNSRLDEIQAAILRVRLAQLDAENAHRSRLAALYLRELAGTKLRLPAVPSGRTHVWHQFVIRSPKRDEWQKRLAAEGVHCGILYPLGLHRQPAYRQPASLPHTDAACLEVLSLPCHPGVAESQAGRIAALLK